MLNNLLLYHGFLKILATSVMLKMHDLAAGSQHTAGEEIDVRYTTTQLFCDANLSRANCWMLSSVIVVTKTAPNKWLGAVCYSLGGVAYMIYTHFITGCISGRKNDEHRLTVYMLCEKTFYIRYRIIFFPPHNLIHIMLVFKLK